MFALLTIVYRLLILTIALIVYGTLYPWHFDFAGPVRHPLLVLFTLHPMVLDRFALRDIAVNLILYLPFGATAIWALERRSRRLLEAALVLIAAAMLSASLEMLQVYIPGRVCSFSDLVCNTIGAATGIALALVYHPSIKSKKALIPGGAIFLVVLFAASQMYPFFPALSHRNLHQGLSRLYQADGFSVVEVWCGAAEWLGAFLVLGAILEGYGRRMIGVVVTVAVVCLPMRMFVATRSLALHEIVGAAVGWLAWMLLRPNLRVPAAAWMLAVAILLRELSPFHFASTAAGFQWIPFWATFDSERQSALVILARKAFDYGMMGWLLRARGISWVTAGVGVSVGLFVLEWVQRWLPGRTAESTDGVLAIIMAVCLWTLERAPGRRRVV